jgi:hypothetical protein
MASTKRARDDTLTEKDSQMAKDAKMESERAFVALQKERDKRVADIESQVTNRSSVVYVQVYGGV